MENNLNEAPRLPLYTKKALINMIEELSEDQIAQVFTYILFVKDRKKEVKTVSPDMLTSLSGLVSWGGDAVSDAERLYE